MRYFITFSYDGSKYSGYQKQPDVKTVQGEIENALKKINKNHKVVIHASGRTDAGVHAHKQKAHFDMGVKMEAEEIQKALNSLLEGSIFVRDAEIVKDDFHARFNVKAKEYVYKINTGEYNPIQKDYIYQHNKRLDIVEIERALKYLEGTHDFKSFSKADRTKEDYVRTIVQAKLVRNFKNVNDVTISFLGTGFHRYMVRNMIGTLLSIGEGKLKSDQIIDILESKDRRKAGITAPPEGLYLKDVFY